MLLSPLWSGYVRPQDKGCVQESGKLSESSSPTRGVRESGKLSKSSSPPLVTREWEAVDAPLPTLEWVCPPDKGCVRESVKLSESSSPTRGVRESGKLSKSSSPPLVTRESEVEDAPLPTLEWVCPQDKGCVRESGKLSESSSPTRGVRESGKLSKSSSPPFVTTEWEAVDAPLPTLEWVCPQDKGCVRESGKL